MSSEREMLENAARAHGGVQFHQFMNYPIICTGKEKDGDPVVRWNPIADDGDAFRLAVKLRLCPKVYSECVVVGNDHLVEGKEMLIQGIKADDPYAATRLAIVRAAAQIGASMKEPTP